MKTFWLFILTCSAAYAQTGPLPEADGTGQERTRILFERAQLEDKFAKEEAQCYQRFAVTDCLIEARTRRREAAADLRRQELTINAEDARRRGAEQMRRIEEKASPQAMADEAAKRAQALEAQKERQKAFDEKSAERANAEIKSRTDGAGISAVTGAQKQSDRARKVQEAAAAKKRYDDKLKDLQNREAQRQKRLAEQKRSQAKPLPAQPR